MQDAICLLVNFEITRSSLNCYFVACSVKGALGKS